MSLRKRLCTMLAVIIALAPLGKPDRVPEPDARAHDTALRAGGSAWHTGWRSRKTGVSSRVRSFHAKNEVTPVLLPLQSKNAKDLAAGKLLVASRDLGDPNFMEAVILLVRCDEQGVVGLILNRRTRVPLSRVLEGLAAAKDRSDPVYLGGPVETPAVFALLQSATKVEGAERIFDGVYLISTKTLFEQTISAQPDPGIFHAYLGYAGWTNDQLRKEVELGAWFIFPAETSTVFNSAPESLWRQMIRKTELILSFGEPLDTEPWTTTGASPFAETHGQ